MAQQLARHGSEAGYKAEVSTGNICERCRTAHRVYARQFRATGKAQGLKYGAHDVIDHLYQSNSKPKATVGRPIQSPATSRPAESTAESQDYGSPEPGQADTGPSLSDRIKGLILPDGEFVPDQDIPDYLHPIDPDPDPPSDDGWSPVEDEEFVINAAGMRKIEDTLGTYLSVLGMTVEMIDPYCGPIIANNMQNVVVRWSKVIAHYPKAANIFLNETGGVLMLWMGAIQSTWPILYALYEHHLAKTVKVENGVFMRRTGTDESGMSSNGFDNLTPPMQESFRYTAE